MAGCRRGRRRCPDQALLGDAKGHDAMMLECRLIATTSKLVVLKPDAAQRMLCADATRTPAHSEEAAACVEAGRTARWGAMKGMMQ